MSGSEILGERYELGVVVGRGGMADVHLATDLLLQRAVAVKVLRDPAGDAADAARFAAEARTLAGLSHRGLVTVLDAGVTNGRPFLVMELVDGPTLHVVIAQGTLTESRIADHGAQVADALAYVHGRGVLHRDVKPGNVLVGIDDQIKLADFGIARLIGDTVRHTRTGQTIGTAAYLAPEQVLGDDLTPAVDVYALGLVLLESLTGERAFPGTPTEAAFARLNRSPTVPTSLSAPWQTLLTDMTAREPGRRPSAADVSAALRDVRRPASADLSARTVAMAPPTRWSAPPAVLARTSATAPLAPPRRINRRLVAVLTAAALLLVSAVLTTTLGGPSAPEPADADAERTEATPAVSPSAAPVPAAASPTPVTTVAAPAAASPDPGKGTRASEKASKVKKPKKAKKSKRGGKAKGKRKR